jgi:CheY-like chemotaxis protein
MSNPSPYLLLADDDIDDQELLAERFLQRNPETRIEFCNNGEEVLHFLQRCSSNDLPAVILLDYKMPVVTGVEVLKIIGADDRYKDVRKLVWSTSGNPEYVGECARFGAERYFTKPGDMHELDEIVSYLTNLFAFQRQSF